VQALAQFQLALADNPASAATWYEKAAVAARTLDFDSALQDLARAAELNNQAASPDKELGLNIAKQQASLLVRGGQLAAAMSAWEQLIANNPADELLLEDIVEQQMAEGLLEQALATTERLLELTKDPYQVVMRRMRQGDILQRAGKQPEALDVYGQTLPRVGRETWLERELIAQIAELFRRDDNPIGLKEYLDKLLTEEPDRLALHKALARVATQLGQTDEAIAKLRQIVELTPGDRENRENLVAALAEAGRNEEAVAQQQALITQFPTDAELSMRLVELQQKQGNLDAARAAMRDFLTKSAFSEAAYMRAARTLAGLGLADETRQVYEEALSRYPQATVVREAFGSWLYQANDKATALSLWQQMADGADKQELLRIARLFSQRGENAEVVRLLSANLEQYGTDSLYLGQLIDAAIALQQDQAAAGWLRRRAAVSPSMADLENTLSQAVIVYRRLGMPLALIDDWRQDAGLAPQAAATAQATLAQVAATCVLAELLEVQGDSELATQVLTDSEARLGNAPDAQAVEWLANQRIRLWTARQEWGQAATAALQLVQSPGGRQSANLRRLVELYMRDEQPEQALAWVEQWKQVSPGSVLPWITESQLLARLNRADDSLRVLRQASRRFPQDADLAAMLAEKHVSSGQGREAERIYWRQFQQAADPAEQLRWVEQLARLKQQLGQTDELVAVFRERQKTNPESIEPLLALALIYREASNYEDRRAVLMEASRKQPDNLVLLLETARLEEAAGDWQEALTTLERALPLDTSGQVAQRMAKICFDFGETDRGLRILGDQMTQAAVGPRDVEALVDAMLKADEWDSARQLLLPQQARFPDDWRLSYLLAVIEQRLGNIEVARDSYLSLLTVENPLPGIKSNPSGFSGPLPQLERLPRAVRWHGNLQYRADEPLAHEEYDVYPNRYAYNSGTHILLPGDPEVCQHYAFWQLVYMHRTHPHSEEGRLTIIRKLGEAGIPDPDLLYDLFLELDPASPYSTNLFTDEIFAQYGDRLSLWQIYALQTLATDAGDLTRISTGFEKFSQQDPAVGVLFGLQIILDNPTDVPASVQQHMPQLLDRLAADEDNQPLALLGFAQLFREEEVTAAIAEFADGDEIGKKLNQLLLDWYLTMDGTVEPWERAALQIALLKSMVESQSAEQIQQLLESELAAAKTNPATAANSSYGSYLGGYRSPVSSDELFQLLEFPPSTLPGVPESILQLPMLLSDLEPWQYDESTGELTDETADLLSRVAQTTKQPVLQATLELALGQHREARGDDPEMAYEPLQTRLREWLDADPNCLEALLLAASLATHQERWLDAASLMERAVRQPLPADQRRRLDSAAAALAIKGQVVDLDQPEQAPLLAVAQSAALRLRRHALSGDQRLELLQALELLDLTEEAGQLESRLAQANNNSGGIPNSYRGNTSTTSPDRIFELLQSDKQDAAFRLLTQDLQGLARGRLTGNLPFTDDDDYELQQFQRTVNQLQVTNDWLKHIANEMGERKELLGFAHELFGDKQTAIDYYQQYVDANPGREAVKARWLLLQLTQPDSELTSRLAVIDTIDSKSLPMIGTSVLYKLPQLPLTFEQRLAVIEKLLDRIDQETPQSTSSLAWLDAAWPILTDATSLEPPASEDASSSVGPARSGGSSSPENLGAAMEALAARLGPLYQPKSDLELSADELGNDRMRAVYERIRSAKLARLNLHERICQLLLSRSDSAFTAFSHWLAVREAEQRLEPASAVEQAATILRGIGSAVPGQNASNNLQQQTMQQMMARMRNSGMPPRYRQSEEPTIGTVRFRTPVEYLSWQLGQTPSDENAALIADLVAALQTQRQAELAAELRTRYDLQSVPEEQFGIVLSRLMSESSQRRNQLPENLNQLILQIYQERKLKVDLLPTFLTQIQADREQKQWVRLSAKQELLSGYLGQRFQQQDANIIEPTFTQIRQAWLGDAATQAQLIDKFGNRANLPSGRGEGAPYATYVTFLSGLIQSDPLIGLAVLQQLEQLQAIQQVSLQYLGYALAEKFGEERDADKVVALLRMTPFLNEVDSFQPYRYHDGDGESLYGTFLNRLRYSDIRARRAVVRKLKEQESTFGLRIFLLVFDKTRSWEPNSMEELHATLKPDLAKLAVMPDDKLKVVADFIREMSRSSAESYNQGDPEVLAVLNRGVEIISPFRALMEARSISSLNIQAYSYGIQQHGSQVLLPLVKEHPDDFVAGMNHLLKLAAPIYRRQGDDLSELVAHLLSGAISTDVSGGLAVSLRYADQPDSSSFDLQEFLQQSVYMQLFELLGEDVKSIDAEGNDEQLDKFVEDLAQAVGGGDVSVLHVPFAALLNRLNLSDQERAAVAAWAKRERTTAGAAAIAQQWWLATQLDDLAKDYGSNSSVDRGVVRKILMDALREPSRGITLRFISANSLLTWKLLNDQPDDFTLCLEVIAENLGRTKQLTRIPRWLSSVLDQLEAIPDDKQLQVVGGKLMTLLERFSAQSELHSGDNQTTLQAIRLYHRLQRPSGIQITMRGLEESQASAAVVGELTRLGYANIAWTQLNRRWGQIVTPTVELAVRDEKEATAAELQRAVFFDAGMESRLPELIALANHPGTKYLTELYLSQLPDPTAELPQPTVSRQQRLERLANQFGEQIFLNFDEQKLALAILLQVEQPPAAVIDALQSTVGKLSPADIWSLRLEEATGGRNRDLFTEQIVRELQTGNVENLNKLIAQVENMEQDDWQTRQALSQLVAALAKNLLRRVDTINAESLLTVAPELLKLEAKDEFNRSNRLRNLLHVWFHVNDRSTEWKTLLSEVGRSSGAMSRFGPTRTPSNDSNIDTLWPLVKRIKPDLINASLDERTRVIKGIWELTSSGAAVGSGHFSDGVKESCDSCRVARMGLDAIEDAGLLSSEELLDFAPELARVDSVNGEIWRQIGHRHMAKQQWAAAAANLKRAVGNATRTMPDARANRQVEYAWSLHQAGETEEVKKLVPRIGSGELFGENPQRLEVLKKLIE
jgi:tetratricopeptide (TPR) repeat protein